jgi:hypothetical protein
MPKEWIFCCKTVTPFTPTVSWFKQIKFPSNKTSLVCFLQQLAMRTRNSVYSSIQAPLLEHLHKHVLTEHKGAHYIDPLIIEGRIINKSLLNEYLTNNSRYIALTNLLYGNPSKLLPPLDLSYEESLEAIATFSALTGESVPNSQIFLFHLESIPPEQDPVDINQPHNNSGKMTNLEKVHQERGLQVRDTLRTLLIKKRDSRASRYFSSFLEGARILRHLGRSIRFILDETADETKAKEVAKKRQAPTTGLNSARRFVVCIPKGSKVEVYPLAISKHSMDGAIQQYPYLEYVKPNGEIVSIADALLSEAGVGFWSQLNSSDAIVTTENENK